MDFVSYNLYLIIFFGVIFSIILLVFFFVFFTVINLTPSTNTKIGYILKVSNEGLINKTNELTIMQGGFVNGSGSNGDISYVTVPNNLLIEAKHHLDNHDEIFIDYHCPFFNWSRNTSSGCFVDKIYQKK